ncbi:MAG: hypothetical protein COX79_05700 [Candidatus Levybacteria bacterium CG_4_10_14_0_2_um_filter_36_16]|nr:MAG: hypothetical protein AUK12_01290 [Candidatus Levybacteria bacterium CG2_30_37_29]PIR78749.1 MAG: hypothetical protein COU26_04910 [Candidatus Levybacteria bacterium CG10_big_fil_rev_8_21_14_0_10_36_30]PIZ96164.1 MAG: hypothetical protein COX79_05700 [Candidatus Levybacteria bacterium CG_4_10_14_0_2_um_filter_36_16]PJA90542.1 MAG: hypothetical protein CO136_01820 [Candidatus Levybacteria bacterium CG_4_9_14_3_um_filter_36_7]
MKKVSDLLREKRLELGFTLEDVERATKIKIEFLKALEEGHFHILPSESYALGFVKNYAKFLDLSLHRVTALFKREYKTEKVQIVPEFRKTQQKFNKRFFSSPKTILIILTFLVIGTYLAFQYGSFFFGPKLEVISPVEGSVVSENVIRISGKTDPYANLFVNNDEVSLSISGEFKKSLYLFSGEQKITIVAKNRFGKETKVVRTVTVKN